MTCGTLKERSNESS